MIALRLFVFLGAFLPFALEPMVGRLLLPSFGGAFHVWTTCLMFFQGALVLGYLYAHLASARVGRFHFALLAAPLALLPPTVRLAPEGGGVGALLAELTLDFGLPFVALTTTAVVAQRWLARSTLPGREHPYGLYAVSNAGSLLALLAYAFLIEPLLGLRAQRIAWALGYVLYVVSAIFAYRATHARGAAPARAAEGGPPLEVIDAGEARPRPARIGYWLALSALPSAFSMAVTNLIALEAGNVPLVWVVPLALYLLTFVLAFSEPSRVPSWVRRLWPLFACVGLFFFTGGETGGTWSQMIVHLAVLFVVCLAAHGELHAQRPAPAHLTGFYLAIALGGWIGGAFVALLAPLAFRGLHEYPIALVGLVAAMALVHGRALWAWARGPGRAGVALSLALVATIGWKLASGIGAARETTRTVAVERSFHGLYHVIDRPSARGVQRHLISGSTRHGRQFLAPEHRREPLSYYHRSGPLGDAMAILRARGAPRRIGAIGLGVGAAAAYLEPGESIDFFEIDPVVIRLARAHFHYLSDCRGRVRTIAGDARLTLARAARAPAPPRYDLLLVDAFAGDAIPIHLVTRQAVELYRSLLAPRGVLLLHISNRYYELRPVLAAIGRSLGLAGAWRQVLAPADPEAADPSEYVVLLERAEQLRPFVERGFAAFTATDPAPTEPWTDDRASALRALALD